MSATRSVADGAPTPSAANMETLVGYILQVGVVLSVALLGVGWLWHWASTGSASLDYEIAGMTLFGFMTEELRRALGGAFRPRLLVSLGIAVLLLTPYVRVVASFLYFALVTHDVKYTVFTGVVGGVLTYSLFLR